MEAVQDDVSEYITSDDDDDDDDDDALNIKQARTFEQLEEMEQELEEREKAQKYAFLLKMSLVTCTPHCTHFLLVPASYTFL